jgi:LuxR family maltose regulon positive regulatory protein
VAKTCQVYQWLAEGNLHAVNEWAKGICASIENPLTFNLELEHIALAKVWLANSQWARALDLLRRLAEAAEAGGRFSRLIKLLIMQSMAYQSIGDHVNSRAIMQRGIQLAEPQGYLRTFTDEGQPTLEILRGFEGDTHVIGQEYLHKLLDSFSYFTASSVLPNAIRH